MTMGKNSSNGAILCKFGQITTILVNAIYSNYILGYVCMNTTNTFIQL